MKKGIKVLLFTLFAFVLVACSNTGENSTNDATTNNDVVENTGNEEVSQEEALSNEHDEENKDLAELEDKIVVRALSGPTGMGMAKVMTEDLAESSNFIDYEIETLAQEVVNGLAKGEIDIAAIPANLAATVYNKTEGKVQVATINTLSVVYIVDNDGSINSIEDLRGKTVYATGQGQTPEYIINQVLQDNGMVPGQDVTFEYKSEPAEVASVLASQENVIALLPQPFITATQMQNDKVREAIDLNQEWLKHRDSNIVTGVLVVTKDFAENHKEDLDQFLDRYKDSIEFVKTNPKEASALIEQIGIVKAPVAEKALDKLNITYIDGQEMKDNLEGYLQVLFEQNPQSIGGALPQEDFYYNK